MAKYTPTHILSSYDSISKINANFDKIATLFEQCVFRDGTAPNAMSTRFDMNHNKIVNVGNAVNSTDAVNFGQVTIWGELVEAQQQVIDNLLTTIAPSLDFTDGIFYPEGFGAVGDGVTDDSAAFKALSTALTAMGGGTVSLRPGAIYIIGGQNAGNADLPPEAGAGNPAYYFQPGVNYAIDAIGCSRGVVVRGNGATFRCAPGAKYGVFNLDGTVNPTVAPYLSNGIAVPYFAFIHARDCTGMVHIEDVELDGNVANLEIGGQWGDAGWQLSASGIVLKNNTGGVYINNVHTHHHALDGIMSGGSGDLPIDVHNVVSEYNGRQGWSITGGAGVTVHSSKFNYSGANGFISSGPGAGIDIEAEDGPVSNGLFVNCEFTGNSGCALIAYSGDSSACTFRYCRFVGSGLQALVVPKPDFKFYNCKMVGEVDLVYPNADPYLAGQFYDCLFTADLALSPTGLLYGSSLINTGGLGDQNILLKHCRFDTNNTDFTAATLSGNCLIQDCTFDQNGTGAALIRGVFLGENVITTAGTNNFFGSTFSGRVNFNGTEQVRDIPYGVTYGSGKNVTVQGTTGYRLVLSYDGSTSAMIDSRNPFDLATPFRVRGAPVTFAAGFQDVCEVKNNGGSYQLNLIAPAVLAYNGTKVVGAQQPAIANATDAASAITQLNLALQTMRNHGLIAT